MSGLLVLRGDSPFYTGDVLAAARRGLRFSITARQTRPVTAAIASIPEQAWTAIQHPRAVFDEHLQQWVSDAEVAQVPSCSTIVPPSMKATVSHTSLANPIS